MINRYLKKKFNHSSLINFVWKARVACFCFSGLFLDISKLVVILEIYQNQHTRFDFGRERIFQIRWWRVTFLETAFLSFPYLAWMTHWKRTSLDVLGCFEFKTGCNNLLLKNDNRKRANRFFFCSDKESTCIILPSLKLTESFFRNHGFGGFGKDV